MARIYEYQGKEILAKSGLAIPKGIVVSDPDQAAQAASTIGKPVVIKAQVWTTGRFKAGGIKFADTPEAAKKAAVFLPSLSNRPTKCSTLSIHRSRFYRISGIEPGLKPSLDRCNLREPFFA